MLAGQPPKYWFGVVEFSPQSTNLQVFPSGSLPLGIPCGVQTSMDEPVPHEVPVVVETKHELELVPLPNKVSEVQRSCSGITPAR